MPSRRACLVLGLGLGSLVPHVVTVVAAYILGRSYIDDTQQR